MFAQAWSLAPSGIRILVLSSFLMSVGFYTLIPQLSLHLSQTLGWPLVLTGLLLGARQLSQQGLTFFGGAIADKAGWKKAIVLGLLVRAAGFFGFAFSETAGAFFVSAILSGLGGAFFEPAYKACFDSMIPTGVREKLIPLREVVANIGFACSAALGLILALADFRLISILSGSLFLLSAIIIHSKLPQRANAPIANWKRGIFLVARNRPFIIYTLMLVGYYYLCLQIWITVPKVIVDNSGSKTLVTLFYAIVSGSVILFQLHISHWLRNYSERFKLIGLGAFSMAAGLFCLAYSSSFTGVALSALLFSAGSMISSPVIFELVPIFARRHWMGAYYGFNGYALAIGGALSTGLGGWVYDLGVAFQSPLLPWYLCLAIGGFVCWGFFNFERLVRYTLPRAGVPEPARLAS